MLLFLCNTAIGQEQVLWASNVIDVSSEFGTEDHSAQQALGVPNALGRLKDHHLAWVPKKEQSSTGEFIEVGFKKAIRVKQIAVAESLNPGAIQRIYLIDTDGKMNQVYENKSVRNILQPFRLFRHSIPKTNYYVQGLRLELKTKSVAGSNQIDAIAISDSGVPIRSKINEASFNEDLSRPEKLGIGINSEYAERLPIISPDGKTLYFARKYHPQNIGDSDQDDIWVSKLERTGKWGFATNIGTPLNNKLNNFVVAFNPTGDVLYLANDYSGREKDGVSVSSKKGRSWSQPKSLNIEDMYNESEFVSYFVSGDGRVLLMSVKRKEGFGDRDIYVSFRSASNKWSKPMNLGETINTVGMESGVFLAADGKTMYFSSNGHPGFGDLDMFMSRRLDDSWTNWTTPKNMGENINSPFKDYNYTIPAKGDYAYFASDDPSGMSDIYRVKIPQTLQPEPVVLYSGKILDAKTQQPIKKSDIKISGIQSAKDPNSLPSNGDYQIAIPYGEDLEVYADVEGYYTVSERIELSGTEIEQLDYDIRIGQSADDTIDDTALEELKEKIAKVNKEITRLESQRKGRQPKVNFAKTAPITEDAELAALKQKYLEGQTGQKVNAPKQRSSASSGDKELDALRAKLGQYQKEVKDEGKVEDLPNQSTAKEDKALAEMKKKYQRYYDDETTTETAPAASRETTQKTNAKEETPDFDFIREKIREEMLAELLPEVIEDLENQIKPKVIGQVRNALSAEDKIYASNPQLEYLLDDRLKEAPLLSEYPPVPRANVKGMSHDLEKAIRKQIKTATIQELEDQYAPLMEEHIEQEFSYLVKKEIESTLAIKLQAEMEKRAAFGYSVAPIDSKQSTIKPLVKEYKEKTIDLIAIPLEEGQTIPLNNIFFDANKSTIKAISETELQRVLGFLNKYSGMIVEIGGHTNGWCSHDYANELSLDRAKEVQAYFLEKGISENRIKFRGYGKTKPIATNETPQGRKKNQRVELKILSMGFKRS